METIVYWDDYDWCYKDQLRRVNKDSDYYTIRVPDNLSRVEVELVVVSKLANDSKVKYFSNKGHALFVVGSKVIPVNRTIDLNTTRATLEQLGICLEHYGEEL